jgi:diguanylate cyclase (GGDEF)-like protein
MATAGGTWLCPDDVSRERILDMERRLKPVRRLAMGVLVVDLVAQGHWMGWWPIVVCVLVGAGFTLTDHLLDRFEHPEYAMATMWAVAQAAIAICVWQTGGALSPSVSWLAIPVVTLPARFDARGVLAGVLLTAALMAAVTVLPDSSILVSSPQHVWAPMALLVAIAILSTALMRSDIDHRTESVIDGLTGMLNRRALAARSAELAAQAELTGQPVGVMIGDLDHFKAVNDEFGHAVGDAVLVDVAYTLRKELRAFDLAYRLGGEEFLILLPGADRDECAELAERLRAAIAAAPVGGRRVTMSFGVATSGGGDFDHEAVLREADAALYAAKRGGRNRVVVAGAAEQALVPVP